MFLRELALSPATRKELFMMKRLSPTGRRNVRDDGFCRERRRTMNRRDQITGILYFSPGLSAAFDALFPKFLSTGLVTIPSRADIGSPELGATLFIFLVG